MSRTIHDADGSAWRLVVRDSSRTGERELEMAKTIPYDGVLVRSTETRNYVSHRKNSTFNLSVSEVIDRYEAETGADIDTCKMCSWPVGSHDDRGDYRTRQFCSVKCDTKHDHIKADARDAERPEPTQSEPADFGGGESTGVQDL